MTMSGWKPTISLIHPSIPWHCSACRSRSFSVPLYTGLKIPWTEIWDSETRVTHTWPRVAMYIFVGKCLKIRFSHASYMGHKANLVLSGKESSRSSRPLGLFFFTMPRWVISRHLFGVNYLLYESKSLSQNRIHPNFTSRVKIILARILWCYLLFVTLYMQCGL